jgi:serpin B
LSEGKNIVFSPLSIYTALGLVAAGARGTTLDELLAVLGASSREEVAEVVRCLAESGVDFQVSIVSPRSWHRLPG